MARLDADGTTVLPTRMSGEGYLPNRNRADKWCLQPGAYRLFMYDNNLISSRNGSMGWDGGSLGITDTDGCLVNGGGLSMSDANAGADIHSATFDFVAGPEGSCEAAAERFALAYIARVDLSAMLDDRGDGGICAFDIDALKLCQYRPKGADSELSALLSGFTAVKPACDAICASSVCDATIFAITGPVPVDYGCCDQEAGEVRKRFGLWEHHERNSGDYGLIPRSVEEAKQRFVALNNRVVGGLLIEQTRRTRVPCGERDRFVKLTTEARKAG